MKIDLSQFPRMGDDITQKLFQVFAEDGVMARFVGGCVRDAILGIESEDIDIAVPIPPDDIIYILTKSNLNVIPTGYEFGTITAVLQDRPFQITALRKDWETDGRYAKVTYGSNWEEDANRRDFTMNALYADIYGTIYDYFNGLEDLKFGIVRFVGEANKRIEEDYLRILRYFRFLAWYGHGPVHMETIQACTLNAHGLQNLSKERIGHEFMKLLAAPMPLESLRLMNKAGISPFILPSTLNLNAFEALLNIEKAPNALCRLAALSLPEIQSSDIAKALRLSREQKQYLHYCQHHLEHYPSTEKNIYHNLYRDGVALFRDLTMLSLTTHFLSSTPSILSEALRIANAWEKPVFPLQGQDLINLGIKAGPKLGALLKECEQWWVDENFHPDRGDCLKWVQNRQIQLSSPD